MLAAIFEQSNKVHALEEHGAYDVTRKSTGPVLTCGGASMKWKRIRSCTPSDFSKSTTLARLVRWISGTAVINISSWN